MVKAYFAAIAFGLGLVVLIVAGAASAEQKKARVFKDPFAYCAFAGTIESPGPSYRGPGSPPDVERIVGGIATFRCQGGQVLGCALGASGRGCMKRDLSRAPNASLISYCRSRPNSEIDYATQGYSAYEWRCRGRTPQIVSGPFADSTGFIAEAWEIIPSRSATQNSTPAAAEFNSKLLGRWEQQPELCGSPPDYALTISRNSFTSFAHSCRFTQGNIFTNAVKGKMSCEYFGEGPKPKSGFNMTIELTGNRTLRFGDTGKELITYHKCR